MGEEKWSEGGGLRKGEKAEIISDTDGPAIPQVEIAEVDRAAAE